MGAGVEPSRRRSGSEVGVGLTWFNFKICMATGRMRKILEFGKQKVAPGTRYGIMGEMM